MTTVVVWKSDNDFSADINVGNIIVASDSKASIPKGTLTENCTKLFEIPIKCQITDDFMSGEERQETSSNLVVAMAGSTIVAHNVVFSLQQALSRLVGASMPTVNEIAKFSASVATSLTREAGLLMGVNALSEIILIGNSSNKVEVISIKPTMASPVTYAYEIISDYPYAIGTGSKQFYKLYQNEIDKRATNESKTQVPVRVLDKFFVNGNADSKSGGELQILSISSKKVTRFSPMRWDSAKENYTKTFYDQEILGQAIGSAHIGTSNWLLDDC
jgi:hypothetical protein